MHNDSSLSSIRSGTIARAAVTTVAEDRLSCWVRTVSNGTEVIEDDPATPRITLVYAEEGSCHLVSKGAKYELATDDFVVLDKTPRALLRATPTARIIILSVPAKVAGHYSSVLQRSSGIRLTAAVGNTASIVVHVLRALAKAADEGRPIPSLRVAQQVAGLIALSCIDQTTHDTTAPTEDLLSQAQDYIEANLSDLDLGQTSIARALHVSTRTLHRSFHAADLSVNAWIRARRLDQCRTDLEDPALERLPVSAIGGRWGLTDAAHFSRLFKCTYGQSPRAYRQNHRGLAASA